MVEQLPSASNADIVKTVAAFGEARRPLGPLAPALAAHMLRTPASERDARALRGHVSTLRTWDMVGLLKGAVGAGGDVGPLLEGVMRAAEPRVHRATDAVRTGTADGASAIVRAACLMRALAGQWRAPLHRSTPQELVALICHVPAVPSCSSRNALLLALTAEVQRRLPHLRDVYLARVVRRLSSLPKPALDESAPHAHWEDSSAGQGYLRDVPLSASGDLAIGADTPSPQVRCARTRICGRPSSRTEACSRVCEDLQALTHSACAG